MSRDPWSAVPWSGFLPHLLPKGRPPPPPPGYHIAPSLSPCPSSGPWKTLLCRLQG